MNKEDLLKIFKNKNNRLICLILIIGVVLMAVASVDKNKKADVQPTAAVTRGVSKSQRCYRDCRRGRKQCSQKCYFRGGYSIT